MTILLMKLRRGDEASAQDSGQTDIFVLYKKLLVYRAADRRRNEERGGRIIEDERFPVPYTTLVVLLGCSRSAEIRSGQH